MRGSAAMLAAVLAVAGPPAAPAVAADAAQAIRDHAGAGPDVELATAAHLKTVSLATFIRRGTDSVNPRYSPLRLGIPLAKIDRTYDYDWPRLEAVQRQLTRVDRRRVLAELFRRICAGSTTGKDKHLAVLEFCNKAGFHNMIQPVWRDRTIVTDPLILLELGEMRCGHVARLAVDLFEVGGVPGRLVQLGGHVTSEIQYDGDWHYLDADLFGARWTVTDEDGSIPSHAELSRRPGAIDALPAFFEPSFENQPSLHGGLYPSWNYFSKSAYSTAAIFYVKQPQARIDPDDIDYGWDLYDVIEDPQRQLGELPRRYFPGAPTGLQRDGEFLRWCPARDRDGDLIGYRVYFGSRSRAWCYGAGWTPEMYDARFQLPPGDVGVVETAGTLVALPPVRPLYVTVMAYDQHGEQVGRTLYPMSGELLIAADEEGQGE